MAAGAALATAGSALLQHRAATAPAREAKRQAARERREDALERLGVARKPIVGKLTGQDLVDLAEVARSPVVVVPTALLALYVIGRSPWASACIEEGVAAISRGVGQGVAAATTGLATGLWEGFVWDTDSKRQGFLESATKTLIWSTEPGQEGGLEWLAKAITPGWS